MDYRVIIVGAGPAGIFAALTLADLGIDRVLLLEQGKDLDARQRQCSEDMLCGWGGAGAYSDGKLTFSSEVGGYLAEYLDRDSLTGLLQTADQMYVRFGAPDRLFGELSPAVEELADSSVCAVDATLPESLILALGVIEFQVDRTYIQG